MDQFRFDTAGASFILACAVGMPPSILYWGRSLCADVTPAAVALLNLQTGAIGAADTHIAASLALEPGLGMLGPPGFSAHRGGKDWGSRFVVQTVETTARGVHILCHDPQTCLALVYDFAFEQGADIFTVSTTLINQGAATLDLVDMATACLPIPQTMTDIIGFSGRWSYEFNRERLSRFKGAYVRENRRGRTSHDSFPAVILCARHTNESAGEAYGVHLAWSGNHRLRVDTLHDGRVFASLGALFFPGEMRLAAGEHYQSPAIVAGYSAHGLSRLSQSFHDHVRRHVLRPSTRAKPRPVHYNTWEAVYFDHDSDQLKRLADSAAAIGVERFVLDDGWFGARRDDRAGLGDWIVSDAVYPAGLGPLIDHVTGLGMEMGIWFEPEMVNPDSDLYRAHPDWVLQIEGTAQVPFRNQYVLDIARAEVSDYLFGHIDAILSDHNIGYIKWDMNRDLNHPGDMKGHARAHAQVGALWALLDRLRAKHPLVEIESCSSGGGRTDYGILAHTDRVWTSDSNDAIDRQAIQRGASHFLPLEVMGAHVGPRHCHITGRVLTMAMRAATALMGHMGLELNLLTEPAADLDELSQAITLYKRHRALLHSGNFVRLDAPAHLNIVGVVAADKAAALYSVAYLGSHVEIMPDRFHCVGLDPSSAYRVRLIWPLSWKAVKSPSIIDALDMTGNGIIFAGEALMTVGMPLPAAWPQTVLLFHLEAIGG